MYATHAAGPVDPTATQDVGSAGEGTSRRAFLAAGATVVAWSLGGSGWLTADTAHAASGRADVPRLDGTLEVGVPAGFDSDFGGFVRAEPWAVLRPGSTADIVAMITFARRHCISVAVNGQSGEPGVLESHSNYGQALTPGGIQIDARSFRTIEKVDATCAVVGAGATWGEVVDAALAVGSTVASLPDYLNLSVGGTISVGGIGGNVQRAGLQADMVRSVEVVTGAGRLVTATARRNSALFDAVLAGGGQVGVITKVELALVPAETTATMRSFYYDDIRRFLADQTLVMGTQRFDYQAGEIVRSADGTSWRFKMEVGSYHSTEQAPAVDDLVARLGDVAAERQEFSLPYRDWAFRLAPLMPGLLAGGYWTQRKPWLSLLIPSDKVETFLATVLPDLTADDLGAGFCLLSPIDPARVRAPLFALQGGADGTAFFFDLLAFPHPTTDPAAIDAMLERNRRLYDALVALGGKRYIIGAIPRMTARDWQRHWGRSTYAAFKRLKRVYDPRSILTPGQGFFG